MNQSPIQALKKAIKIAGSQSALALALGVKQAHVWQWLHRGKRRVPAEHCLKIEEITKGEVTRYELRPDVFGRPSSNHSDGKAA